MLGQASQTSKDIKLGREYAQVKINKAMGRKADPDLANFGPSFMGDQLENFDMFDDERAV